MRPTHGAQTVDYGPLEGQLGFHLQRARLAVFQNFFAVFGAFNISPAAYCMLILIDHNPGLTPTQLAKALAIKTPNVVGILKALERDNLVTKERAAHDGRAVILSLTQEGKSRLHELNAAAKEHENQIRAAAGDSYENLFAPLAAIAKLSR